MLWIAARSKRTGWSIKLPASAKGTEAKANIKIVVSTGVWRHRRAKLTMLHQATNVVFDFADMSSEQPRTERASPCTRAPCFAFINTCEDRPN
eukprot:2653282-Pleurochrysis_carterae.AAC.1